MSAIDLLIRELEQFDSEQARLQLTDVERADSPWLDSRDSASRLRRRLEALDRLEAHLVPGPVAHGPVPSGNDALDRLELHARTVAMCARLEAANAAVYESLRRAIRQGGGPGGLLAFVAELDQDGHHGRDGPDRDGPDRGGRASDASDRGGPTAPASDERYDHLDALVSGILQFDEPDARIAELEPEMVFYQPTPARHVFDLLVRTALTESDVLVDLGSGLGHVPLLVAICTPARSIGIEREAAYVECARRSARALNLTGATFLRQDARAADFSCGTVFYLYTPFSGAILRDVLDSLRRQAVDREIRVCTYGPCTPVVAAESWLEAVGAVEAGRVAVFRSCKRATPEPNPTVPAGRR